MFGTDPPLHIRIGLGRMRCKWFVSVLVFSVGFVLGLATIDDGILVVAPGTFRIGVPEMVFVQSFMSQDEASVTLSLHRTSSSNDLYGSKIVRIKKNEQLVTTLTLNATAPSLIADLKNYMSGIRKGPDVKVILRANLEGAKYGGSASVKVSSNPGIVFLQTDKPIYTPGQEVKLRIIQTDNSLKSLSKSIILEVLNPKHLIVFKEEMKDFPPSKILKHTYSIGPEPILGLWTIRARSGYKYFTVTNTTFEVREYVLPTFDVHIDLAQKYILPETQILEGKVTARYTFREPVEGTVALQYFVRSKTGELQQAFEDTAGNLTRGQLDFKCNLTELRPKSSSPLLTSWFPGIAGSRLRMEAIVMERGTLTREIKRNEAALFVTSPYVISFKRTLPDFKPGYSYTIQVDVHHPNGDPAVGVPVAVSEVTLGDLGTQERPPPQATDSRGRAAFTLAVPFDIEGLTATIVTRDTRYGDAANAEKKLTLKAHRPVSSGGYLWLQPRVTLEDVRVGSVLTVEASVHNPSNHRYSLYYLVVSRGSVVSWGQPIIQRSTYLWVLNVQIKPEMSPSFRLLVYAIQFGDPNYFLADSLRVEVDKKCPYRDNRELTLSLPKDHFAPKEDAFLTVGGELGSFAGVMAVDRAIYALRNESILTRSKMFTDLDKTDVGHGPGGGRTVEDILQNAGLVVVTSGERNVEYKAGPSSSKGTSRTLLGRKALWRPRGIHTADGEICCKEASTSYRQSGFCTLPYNVYCSARDRIECKWTFERCCPDRNRLSPINHQCEILERTRRPNFSGLPGATGFEGFSVVHPSFTSSSAVEPPPDEKLYSVAMFPEAGRRGTDTERESDDSFDDEEFYAEPTEDDVRREFPESWLYEDFEVGGSHCPKAKDGDGCQLTIKSFPDSITTWNFHGLAISNKTGFCIAEPISATVKLPLFVKLKLPYAAVRTEVLELVATVFNYGSTRLRVLVHLHGVEGLCCEAKPGTRGKGHSLVVPPNGAASHRFYVIPKKTGEFSINVTVRSTFGSDVVIKTLRVRDEGVRQSKSSSQLLDPSSRIHSRTKRSELKEFQREETDDLMKFLLLPPGKFISSEPKEKWASVGWDVMPPTQAIPGTVRATLELTSNVFAPTLETTIDGVEGFFQDAVGCAEQSMIRIAPTLYGALYLNATEQLTFEKEEKVKKHLTQGYAHVLKYRQPDGGISVWAGPNHKPTLWLTSYFMRVFCEMRPFVSSVQSIVISSGLKWMATQQKTDGSFDSMVHTIHHKDMTGGLQGTTSLTAFILTSYLACRDIGLTEVTPEVVSKAKSYLEMRVESVKRHPYALALVTYVLALVNSTKADVANGHLRALAQEDDQGNRFWVFDVEEIKSHGHGRPWVYTNRPRALNVEITAYALLAQVTLDSMDYAGPIVAWLVGQRNSKGAFVSTQDTVVTLEALAAYGKKAKEIDKGHTSVRVFANDVPLNDDPLLFDKNCKDVVKTLEVPVGKKVLVKAQGDVPVSATLQIKYNSPGKSDLQKAYTIEIIPVEVAGSPSGSFTSSGRDIPALSRHVVRLNICISYTLKKSSGMVIARIGIPTGYKVDQTDLKNEMADEEHGITNMEVAESSIILYYDQIPQSPDERCFDVLLRQMDDVRELQPSSVRVYTYYEPDEESVQFYTVVSGNVDTKDHCVGEMCNCIKGTCPIYLDSEQFSAKKDIGELNQLIDKMAQNDKYCYVMQIMSQSVTEDTMHVHQKTVAKIVRVVLEGREKTEEVLQKQREFYASSKCDSFKVNSYVLVSGKTVETVKTIHNDESIRYILDDAAVVIDFPSTFVDEIPEKSMFGYVVKRLETPHGEP